ncbi:TIGR00282 family metallophosphoesterase [Alkalibacter mobilis]|uniref:TIGR00282 family metallophosphoesterase n=1 Tax=Alkalibacter mobilis TaxID=2787712 RepID=UPI0018A0F293|nr:TIGR00282 family metallophosphoesterase [Alkalibacter mobilis]MBF7095719.1 TIGR00282 family metallophosphoesterase [Alkalibacter mobilis]
MRVLILGDIVGRPGRTAIKNFLNDLKQEFNADMVIVNGENATAGLGIIEKHAKEFIDAGVDVITTGNHVWDKKETENYIDDYSNIIRPANYPDPCPGKGFTIVELNDTPVAVINLSGLSFLKSLDCPFKKLDRILEEIPKQVKIKILDFHAETTSEKLAMGYYSANRLSLVFGTHTHVQTSDFRILDDYTGYITDVGMTGPLDGVIGIDKDIILKGFLTKRPVKYEIAEGKKQIDGLIVEFNESTGQCTYINAFIKVYD